MSSAGGDAGRKRQRTLEDFAARFAVRGQSEAVDATAVTVTDAFQRAGVPVMLLKGPVLARVLYRPDERRNYNDLDVLVSPDARPRARETLTELGYEKLGDRGVDDFIGILHAESWLNRPDTLLVDLHWRLAGCSAEPEKVWARLYETRSTIDVSGRSLPTLGRDGLALHLSTHAAQHGPSELKAMADLTRGVVRWEIEDWRAAARLAAALGATEAFAAGLRLLPEGAELAESLALPATPRLSWEIRHRDSRPRGAFHFEAFADASGIRQRAEVLRRSLLPRPKWIARRYPWVGQSRRRLAAAYVRHLVSAPLWAFRAWRFSRRAKQAAGATEKADGSSRGPGRPV